MVKLMPPPAGVADKLVYDYLFQLQEYLGLALEEDTAAAAAGRSGYGCSAARGSAAARDADGSDWADQYQALKALVIKTAGEVRRGRSGKTIDTVTALYCLGPSPTDCPQGPWGEGYPAGEGFVWSKLRITYAGDHPPTETTPVCLTGNAGESAYALQILSTNGGIFKNGGVSTTLRAVVWYGSREVTEDFDNNCFRWHRVSADAEADGVWNAAHFGGKRSIEITAEDVQGRATFFCTLIDPATRRVIART